MRLFSSKIWAFCMSPFSFIYYLIVALRNWAYDREWLAIHRVAIPVIAVGNITVGGVGKTPLVIWFAQRLQKQGLRVGIVSRGYGRASKGLVVVSDGNHIVCANEGGDEPVMIANRCQAVVIVCEDRATAARKAVESYHVDVIVLDDAFQHRRLYRDWNVVMIHGKQQFGNGSVLPGGPLRESIGGLNRADVLVFSHAAGGQEVPESVARFQKPVVQSTHQPEQWMDLADQTYPLPYLKGKRVVAFSGIANPNAFFKTVSEQGCVVVAEKSFPDHHAFSNEDITSLVHLARLHTADALVMTEKDRVKIKQGSSPDIPMFSLNISLKIISGQDVLDQIVHSVLKAKGGSCGR